MDKIWDRILWGMWVFMLMVTAIATIPADFEQDMALVVAAIGFSGIMIQVLGARERGRQHEETTRLLRRIAGVDDEQAQKE